MTRPRSSEKLTAPIADARNPTVVIADLDSREESLNVLVKALNDARVSNALIRQLLDARAAYGNYRGFCRCKEPVE